MDLNSFIDMSKEDILKNCTKILCKDKDLIESFLKNKSEEKQIYPYYLNYMYHELMSNKSYKYIILEYNEDKILVILKDIKIFTTKYLRLLSYLISKNNNAENENYIMRVLKQKDLFKEGHILKDELNNFQDKTEEVIHKNFYVYVDNEFKRVNKHKFKYSHKIDRMLGDVCFRKAEEKDLNSISNLVMGWKEHKNSSKKHSVQGKTLFKNFLKKYNEHLHNNDFTIYVLSYRNVIIALTVFVKMYDDAYYQLINMAYSNKNIPIVINEREYENLHHIARLQYYFYINDAYKNNIKKICFGGASYEELLKFKMGLYKNFIPYYRVDLINNKPI